VVFADGARQELSLLLNQVKAAFSAAKLSETVQLCRRIVAIDRDNLDAYLLWAYAELPGENYPQLLARIHRHLNPRTYVGIGIEAGQCLTCALPQTTIVGIDPKPQLQYRFGPQVRIFSETSDDFFARHDLSKELGGRPVDLAFIDGMHLLEFALRDFINLEKHALPTSTILAHDCLPLDETELCSRMHYDFLERGYVETGLMSETLSTRSADPHGRRATDWICDHPPPGSVVHSPA